MTDAVAVVDVLRDPLFTLNGEPLSLPGVMAWLSVGTGGRYDAMQPHQAYVWHMFVVQLAVIALDRSEAATLPTDESDWRELLAALTSDPSAWWVEQPDLSRPAFLQPPLPDGEAALTKEFPTPDALDVLSTAKNHDVKRFRAVSPRIEHWLYALVTLQTSSGLLGRGNYGVTRMNGGYASRACVAYYRSLGWAERFREDVHRILERGLDALDERGFDFDGPALLWTVPWGPGKEPLPLDSLHPSFIEVCRRIRCVSGVWKGGTTGSERIGAKALKGDVGDPWLPITQKGGALNVQAAGFDYKLLVELIAGRISMASYMGPTPESRWLVGSVLAGQQGGTNGFHTRSVPIPSKPASILAKPSSREKLVERATFNRSVADGVRRKCLLPALLRVFDEDLKSGSGFRPYLRAFDTEVDAVFFDVLWAGLMEPPEVARAAWLSHLRELGEDTLKRAAQSAPNRSGMAFKRRAIATSIFGGSFHKNFSTGGSHVA